MQDINVFENGIGYLSECMGLYLGGCSYLLLYLFAVIFIMVKGSKRERELFVAPTVVLMLTVYNPFIPLILDKIFDVSSEYYRLFWIAPVIIVLPLVISKIFTVETDKKKKQVYIIFTILILIFAGNLEYINNIKFSENIYKIPDELIEISEIIHGDSDQEYTKAFFEYEYNMEIRQYDPKMLLAIDREEYIYAVNYSYTDDMLNDENVPTNKILAALVRNQNVDPIAFADALEQTKTSYVVLTKGNYQTDMLAKAGLYLIADTDMHLIYKYDLKEPYTYELVDYTGVEHRFSTRRLK